MICILCDQTETRMGKRICAECLRKIDYLVSCGWSRDDAKEKVSYGSHYSDKVKYWNMRLERYFEERR